MVCAGNTLLKFPNSMIVGTSYGWGIWLRHCRDADTIKSRILWRGSIPRSWSPTSNRLATSLSYVLCIPTFAVHCRREGVSQALQRRKRQARCSVLLDNQSLHLSTPRSQTGLPSTVVIASPTPGPIFQAARRSRGSTPILRCSDVDDVTLVKPAHANYPPISMPS